jgi:hypothetical protein
LRPVRFAVRPARRAEHNKLIANLCRATAEAAAKTTAATTAGSAAEATLARLRIGATGNPDIESREYNGNER